MRVGLHTGTPLLTDEGYVGDDVHRAARIAAAGHGGQVLVSSSTAQLAERELRDLGEHRLKDLSASERIYQLGEGDFPALKSLYRTNLPVPATPLADLLQSRSWSVRRRAELRHRDDHIPGRGIYRSGAYQARCTRCAYADRRGLRRNPLSGRLRQYSHLLAGREAWHAAHVVRMAEHDPVPVG